MVLYWIIYIYTHMLEHTYIYDTYIYNTYLYIYTYIIRIYIYIVLMIKLNICNMMPSGYVKIATENGPLIVDLSVTLIFHYQRIV